MSSTKNKIAPKITQRAQEQPKAGDKIENSPYPVKTDKQGNRLVIPSEKVKFKFSGNNTHVSAGTTEVLHTILAEDLSARGKGEILGKADEVEIPGKYEAATLVKE